MGAPHLFSGRMEGKTQGRKVAMVSALLILRSGRVWSWLPSYPFQNASGKVDITSALLKLRSGGVLSNALLGIGKV